MEATRQVTIPHYKAIIMRKTFPQLRELIDKSLNYYLRAFKGAKYNSTEHTWRFPSGAKIIFGNMQNESTKYTYQGQSFDVVEFDELTHFTYDEYMYMFSRCRPNGAGTECYIRSTANPGGIGHSWVKERFRIGTYPSDETIWEDVEWISPDGHRQRKRTSRVFIPSSVFDNKALLDNDPDYVMRLASLPEAEKNALLYGDWDAFEGQAFPEFKDVPSHYFDREGTHVIAPFDIPREWKIYCGLDWGYSRPYSIGWYAVDHDGRIYKIRELYGCTGVPNHGVMEEPTEVARQIHEIESSDTNLKGKKIYRVGDPAIWGSQTKESIGMMFERERIYWEKGNNARLDGKMQFHYRLAFDENGIPMFYVFNTCKHFIRTVPTLIYSTKQIEDVDTDGEDHIYDETKYVMMEMPITPKPKAEPVIKPYNPLDANDNYYLRNKNRAYAFYQKY